MSAQGAMGYRGMGHMGNVAQGTMGTGVWATGGMGHISNGGIGAMGYRVCGVQGVWGRWAMEYMCNGAMVYRGMGYRGYGAHE